LKKEKNSVSSLLEEQKLIDQYANNEVFFTQTTMNNQKLCNYAIEEGTYKLIYFNEYTKEQFPEVKYGALCYKAICNNDFPCETCPLKGLNDNNNTYTIDSYNGEKDTWYSTTASKEITPDGEKVNLIYSSDVSGFVERVKSKDTLTGLLTLSKFEVEAMKLIATPSKEKYFIIYSDFDKFKNINDECGYFIGNEMLIHYARIASRYLKPSELFCRITADKFAMMITYHRLHDALERLHNSYYEVEKEFKERFPKINSVITSGLYFLTPEDKNISLVLDKANLARKTIKGTHKSNFAIYDRNLHDKITKEKQIESNMYVAIKNHEFLVYMQPKIDLATSKINGAEALVRWRLPSGEILGPMEFIPLFEKNGFINELDFYVYEKTFQAIRQWLDMGKREIVVSVNVSRSHLKDPHFIERLEELLNKYQISTRLIELEITESMFFIELDRVKYIIKSLRRRGFIISIDDFGSGYSSLNMLKTLPIDILKLDRDFFMKNEMGSQDKIVISGIISLAKGLGLKVISEGVETSEQLSFLKESLCDMAQGYLFYKPMPLDEFEQLLD
jgi:diguanylate cyclase (GGDEF)-like protein